MQFSTSASLAAFLATLGKQWLKLHVEGSFIGRNHLRELKVSGMIAWRFKVVMECLPLIREASLLLLGCAQAQYLWDLGRTVSSVITVLTAFGLALYLFIVVARTASKACSPRPWCWSSSEPSRGDIRTTIGRVSNFLVLKRPQKGLITPPSDPRFLHHI